MAFDCEVDALRDRVDGALQRRVIEGDYGAALVADEVMVMVVGADRLVARLRLAELDLADHAQLVELGNQQPNTMPSGRALAASPSDLYEEIDE